MHARRVLAGMPVAALAAGGQPIAGRSCVPHAALCPCFYFQLHPPSLLTLPDACGVAHLLTRYVATPGPVIISLDIHGCNPLHTRATTHTHPGLATPRTRPSNQAPHEYTAGTLPSLSITSAISFRHTQTSSLSNWQPPGPPAAIMDHNMSDQAQTGGPTGASASAAQTHDGGWPTNRLNFGHGSTAGKQASPADGSHTRAALLPPPSDAPNPHRPHAATHTQPPLPH